MRLPKRLQKMVSPKGFDEVFYAELHRYESQRKAFNALNQEYAKTFGQKRYKNFESYRKSRSKRE